MSKWAILMERHGLMKSRMQTLEDIDRHMKEINRLVCVDLLPVERDPDRKEALENCLESLSEVQELIRVLVVGE